MDKKFVTIDDLVRQRLGGGEEPERAGAWLQMRDLLDEEMPQSRVGFIFWRRLFSAIAVLAFISTAGIGGYMYTTSTKSGINENNIITNNSNAAASNTPSGDLTINVSSAPSNTTEINSSKQISTLVMSNHLNITTNEHANKQNNDKTSTIAKQANKQILAAQTITPDNTKGSNKKPKAAVNDPKFLTRLIAANEHSKETTKNEASPIITGANNTGNTVLPAGASRHYKANTIHKNMPGNSGFAKAGNHSVNNNPPINSISPSTNNKTHGANSSITNTGNSMISSVANNTGVIKADKLALSSSTNPSGKHVQGVNTSDVISGKTNKTALNSVAKKPIANNNRISSSATTNNKNTPAIKKDAEPTETTKQTWLRLQLSEHLVIAPTGETYYKLDTTSIETISEQLGLNNMHGQNPDDKERNKSGIAASAPGVSASAPDMASGGPNTTASANTAGTNISGSNTGAQSAGNPNILPAASASATGQSGMGIKESQASKMSGSASTAEKLSSTFNDIKFHVASAQFAAGLTAGINGTFFGPASFKGFQFGVTGNFIFGDNFSILTELKYFERINNNYTLNDNYYTYTPAGGGQYNKVLNSVPYSFSTLHSLELPVSIRYCKSHFNFYVGGNIVYTFAINTAAGTSTPTTTLVSSPGNNSEPTIKQNDFDSKFGLGYLFGISYQVSPSVMLDFRNVQTLWNDASTPGAKTISNQLYKSPSLQVSIGYRFGGNKDKNKDQ